MSIIICLANANSGSVVINAHRNVEANKNPPIYISDGVTTLNINWHLI